MYAKFRRSKAPKRSLRLPLETIVPWEGGLKRTDHAINCLRACLGRPGLELHISLAVFPKCLAEGSVGAKHQRGLFGCLWRPLFCGREAYWKMLARARAPEVFFCAGGRTPAFVGIRSLRSYLLVCRTPTTTVTVECEVPIAPYARREVTPCYP